MAGQAEGQEKGLSRISEKEMTNQMGGRGTDAVPQQRMKLRGDKNPVAGGGINRPTQGKMKGT